MISLNNFWALDNCETWLTGDTPSSFVELHGINFSRTDVVGTVKKHGVGLYLNRDLKGVSDDIVVTNVLSVLSWILYLHIVVVYRPTSYSEAENEIILSFHSTFCLSRKCYCLAISIYLH